MTGTIAPPRPASEPKRPLPGGGRSPVRRDGLPNRSWRDDRNLPATISLSLLTLAVALGFGRLFDSGKFLMPVVLATVVGHVVAWWCRRNNIGTGMASVLTLLAVGLVAAWTVLGHTTAYGIPIPFTMRSALTALASARDSFSVVRAPAEVAPGFLLATLLALGVTAFMADWAAFRLQATFEAIIPAFTLFIFTCALGTTRHRTWAVALFVSATLAFLVVHGLARSNRAGAWFGGRPAGGLRNLVRNALALGAIALVAGLLAGPLLPGAGDPPLLRYKNRPIPGPTNRATISPLVDIRGRLVEQRSLEVFTVESETKAYWRLTSLDTFDGSIWSSNDTYRPTRGQIRTDEPLRPDLPVKEVDQKFAVRALASIWLPAAFRPQAVRELRDISYNRNTASIITPSETTDGLQFTVRSEIPQLTPELLGTAESRAPQAIVDQYLGLPAISDRVKAEARRITASASTPYQRARALQDYFHRGFVYDLNARPGHDNRALENFVFRTKRGYCEQYAGTYAVLARLVGLPARVAVGFTPGELQSDGLYHVRDEHAHAWPEVYLHGFGWVAFEPTPGRGAPGAQPYTGQPEGQETSGDQSAASTVPSSDTTVVPEDSPATSAPTADAGGAGPNAGEDRGVPGIVKFFLALLAFGVLWAIVVPALHLRRRRQRHAQPGGAAHVLASWADAAEVLAAAGVGRKPAETLTEYAGRAVKSAGLQSDPARSLRSLATDAASAAYAGGDLPDEVAARSRANAEAVKAAVLDQVSVSERLRWWLDPRPLLATR